MGKKGGGKHLKSALLSQQSRLKAKEKISHAAQVQNQKASRKGAASSHPSASSVHQNPYAKGQKAKASSSSSLSSSSGHPKRPPTIPFLPTDRILLLGEGNFSFTRALVVSPPPPLLDNPIPPTNITATAYDSEQECYEKYSDAREIVGLLRETGVNVVFGVDATKLARCAALKGKVWDKIVWNFPHAGKGITDQDRNILTNQLLLLDFLASASKVLAKGPVRTLAYGKKKKRKPGDEDEEEDEENDGDEMEDIVPTDQPKSRGTVLITLRNVAPYTSW
ncbi:hypothetical protein CC2G_000405 [Coprinopsis cinerea AmutBmut pab1-1]|nr:hypothetical protein CC2G_000405 [Coprinopsis cinerea AmutBmut pab1-1]